ncbi:MAG: sigma-70 family RNA polymerase sigma factor [Gammaproteobacteria bacterium]|nr:sigma-70 family RNA polymerase sigma factor [Gammaproteobacteria bacterium]
MSENDTATDSDLRLIARVAIGDQVALETLFTTYGERVFRYAHRMISDVSRAEEVTNDVMMEIWKNAGKFEGRSKVSTWILGITRHLALNAVRGKKLDTIDIDDAPEIADTSQTAQAGALSRDRESLTRDLRTALGQLSADHRDVVELTFFHGHSYQEIAEIVGCPENTVKTRMFHARKQLKAILMVVGVDLSSLDIAGDAREVAS